MSQRLETLVRPPRSVPLSLRVALRVGGVAGTIGWIFLAAGLLFVFIFSAVSDFGRAIALSTTTLQQTDGVTLGWAPTNAMVNDEPVMANGATFQVQGVEYECRSYAVADGRAQGDPVVVEYDPNDPSLCRIAGMDASTMPLWTLLIMAPFVLIGLGFAGWRWRRGGVMIGLLRDGKVARGERVDKQPTGVRVNDRMQFKYTFRFEDERGRTREAFARTTDTRALEDEAHEAILYDPYQTSLAMVADTEAKVLRLDARGQWESFGARVIPRMIAPVISLALAVGTVLVF